MRLFGLLIAALICAGPVQAAQSEREILEEVLEAASQGGLGFEFPKGFTYDFNPKYGACGRLMNLGCLAVESDEPFSQDDPKLEPVWALTTRSTKSSLFFRGSAEAQSGITIAYRDPAKDGDSVSIVAPQPFTAHEMAGNYYGLKAVKAYRAFLKR